jgi:hypothetical protein
LTNRSENKKEFSFISSGELKNDEIILLSTKRLLDYLSENDLLDGIDEEKNIKVFSKNIKDIL